MASADVAAPPAASSEGSTTTTTTGSEKQHQQVKQDTDKTAGKQDESTPQRPGQGSREQPVQLTLDALLGGNGKDSSKDEQQQQQQPRKLNLSAMDAKSYPESTADSGETFGVRPCASVPRPRAGLTEVLLLRRRSINTHDWKMAKSTTSRSASRLTRTSPRGVQWKSALPAPPGTMTS